MSPHLVNAVLVTEDKRFYDHDGIDLRRIVVAVCRQPACRRNRAGRQHHHAAAGAIDSAQIASRTTTASSRKPSWRGGSKSATPSATSSRPISIASISATDTTASRRRRLATSARPPPSSTRWSPRLLAGLIKGPSLYSPTKAPELARKRRDLVLGVMRADGMLTAAGVPGGGGCPGQCRCSRQATSGASDPRRMRGGEYFRDAVSRELIAALRRGSGLHRRAARLHDARSRLQALAEETVVDASASAAARHANRCRARWWPSSRDRLREGASSAAATSRRAPSTAPSTPSASPARRSSRSSSRWRSNRATRRARQLDGLDQPIPTPAGAVASARRARDRRRCGCATRSWSSSNRAAAHLLQEVGVNRTLDLVQRFGVSSPMPNVPVAGARDRRTDAVRADLGLRRLCQPRRVA